MKKLVAIFIIIIVLSGFSFILALQSAYQAMAAEMPGNSVSCLEHCLASAAPFSQQDTIMTAVLLLLAAAFLGAVLIVYNQTQSSIYFSRFAFHPFYIFKTIILRE